MATQEIDLNRFRLKEHTTLIPKPRRSASTSRLLYRFLKGPIPLWWIHAAGMLPGRALHVGVELWYRVGLCQSKVVHFSYKSAEQFGVKRHTAYRALKSLEAAGLVSVHRAPGRCPVVTILDGNGMLKSHNLVGPGFHQKS